MRKLFKNIPNDILLFFIITGVLGMALGLSDTVFSNYFKDAYNVDAYQRGLIEFPRELPGLLCIIAVSALSFLGDIRLAILTQALSFVGIMALGLLTPAFSIMLIFLFINSLGMHIYMPIADSIGMGLIKNKNEIGKRMGQYKSVGTAFNLLAGLIVFFGFRYNLFSFKSEIKWIFVVSGFLFFIVFLLYIRMNKMTKTLVEKRSFKILFKKDYKLYYILATLHGAQKQIMIVFGPWVLIDILGKGAETMSMLTIIGSFFGIFFLRILGKWIDKFGIKNLLLVDALSFIGVYILYGLLSSGFHNGTLATVGLPFILMCALFILDRMSMQMGIIRVVYLKSIAHSHADITQTLSLGISMDHIVSIICAYLGGMAWMAWGPQYVFFIAAGLSVINLIIARIVKIPQDEGKADAKQEAI